MDVQRNDDGTFSLGFDTDEYLAITQSFGWLRRGLNRLRGEQFDERLHAPEEEVDALAGYLLDAARKDASEVRLDSDQLRLIDDALSEILIGPAAVPAANTGEPDWELIGGVSADRFAQVRRDIRSLVR